MISRVTTKTAKTITVSLAAPVLAAATPVAAASLDAEATPAPPSPATRLLQVPGGAIAYDDTGSGPVVICVPSMGDLRAEYRFLRPQLLAAGFRVVTMDLRGYGESSATFTDYTSPAIGSDILALAWHLDAGPVSVVATSISAGAAAWAAAQEPDLIGRLVLIGAFVRDHGSDAALRLFMNAALRRPWGAAVWTMYFPNLYPGRKPADFQDYLAHLRRNLQERGRLEAMRAMMNRSDAPVEASLDRVSAHTLVVMGTKDPDFKDPVTEAGWIAEKLHGTTLLIEGAGHYPHAEAPDVTGPQIVAFLQDAGEPGAS